MSTDAINLIGALTFVAALLFILGCVVGSHYKRLRDHKKRYRFSIVDLWITLACLLPHSYALACVLKAPQLDPMLLGVGLLSSLGVLAGAVVGRMKIELPPHHGPRNAFQSAVSIVMGALLGFIFFPIPIAAPLFFIGKTFDFP